MNQRMAAYYQRTIVVPMMNYILLDSRGRKRVDGYLRGFRSGLDFDITPNFKI